MRIKDLGDKSYKTLTIYIQHNDIQHNDNQHNGTQHDDPQHDGPQHDDTQHNNTLFPYWLMCQNW